MSDAKIKGAKELLAGPLSLVHLGLDKIMDGAQAAGAPFVDVDFQPPAGGDPERMRALRSLAEPSLASEIEIGRAHV